MAPRPDLSRSRLILPPQEAGRLSLPIESQDFPRLDVEQVRQILPQLIDALTDGVVVVDRTHHVVAANQRFAECFGLLQSEIVGSACCEALDCPEADQRPGGGDCAACEVIRLKSGRRLLRTLPDATGVLRRWETTLNPLLDAEGEVTHVVEVWRDITDRSQLESQLSHSERLASLGMLAAGVAHEINNPLASIVAGVESLSRWLERVRGLSPDARAEVAELIDLLERETLRSRETTEKLLLLAQPIQVAPSWTDVNRAVRDTLALLRYQMNKQRVTAVEDLEEGLPRIWARGSGIRSVLMNLSMNAVQALPSGGTITVRTRTGNGGVEIEVEDDGPGIHPAHLDRIWDPFFTTKPVGHGTGLGLSISQSIVRRHGGDIHVENADQHGARFVVRLPIEGPGGENV